MTPGLAMTKLKIKAPKPLRSRLRQVARAHDFDSERAVIEHFIERGLQACGVADVGDRAAALDRVVEDKGYSSREELIEHLLLRGLRAYEEPGDPDALRARLRGLGYID